jgi:hypothetical protein
MQINVSSQGNGIIVPVVGLCVGGYLFYNALVWLRLKRLIENTPTSKIRSIAMGLVEVFGSVEAIDNKILKSPIANKKCLYYKYCVQEYKRENKRNRWVTIREGTDSVCFELKDETGRVTVDPNGAQVEIPVRYQLTSDNGSRLSKNLKDFLNQQRISYTGGLFSKGLVFNKRLRFIEHFIAPKDKLYIMGTAGDNPLVEEATGKGNTEDIMIQKGAHEKTFYISDKKESEIVKRLKFRILGGFLGGGALIVFCLGILLYSFGVF